MLSLITKLRTRGSDRKASSRKTTRHGFRPAIEGLEGRISLSAMMTSVPTPTTTTSGTANQMAC